MASLPLDALCDRLLGDLHAPIHAAVPTIRARLAVLADRTPQPRTEELRRAFAAAAERLAAHLAKEENIVFPALIALAEAERAGRSRPPLAFPTVLHPIRALEAEHRRLAAAIDELTALSDTHPDRASAPWTAVRADLAALHRLVAAHVQVEDEVLFPRALELDARL
ncbi:MAG: hemerythrin domain-containing protein [Vicinamibacterales bacterium]